MITRFFATKRSRVGVFAAASFAVSTGCLWIGISVPAFAQDITTPIPTATIPVATAPPTSTLVTTTLTDIQATLQDAILGQSYPNVIHLRDVTKSWRIFQAGTADQQLAALGAYMAVLAGGKTPGNQYFTDGRTIMIGDTPYLIAYRMPTKSIDVASMLGPRGDFGAALPDIITPDTILTLSLMNLRTLGAIDNIQPVDVAQIILQARNDRAKLASALGAHTDEAGVGYLNILADAVLRATKDRAGVLPPMQSMTVLARNLGKYVGDHSVFTDPLSHRPFYTNPGLSNKDLSSISDVSNVVLAYSDSAGADGLRAVAFLDGTARLVDVDEWASLQSSQQLP